MSSTGSPKNPSADPSRRGRRRTRTPDEIRSAMITAGLALLAERGVTVGLDLIRFDDVIMRSGVPRASAYRAWKRDDSDEGQQVIFQDALAAAVIAAIADDPANPRVSNEPYEATVEALDEVVARLPDLSALSDVERGEWFRTIHRAGTDTNQQTVDTAGMWLSYIAIAAGLASQQDNLSDEMAEIWRRSDLALSTQFVGVYKALAGAFGFRIRPCYEWEHLAVAACAMGEGLATRANVNKFTDGIVRHTGPDGEQERWSLFSVAFEGLLRQFLEPDPDAPFHTPLDHEPC